MLPDLVPAIRDALDGRTAGDPVEPEVIWTDQTPRDLQERLAEKDLPVGRPVIRRLLVGMGYRRRRPVKYLDMGGHADRDAQFRNIGRLRAEYLAAGDPVVSIDTKKRELVGPFHRAGSAYCRQAPVAYDHDFPGYAEGVVIPYGVYDVRLNSGYINIGTSHDTSEFACDSIGWWWGEFGRRLYPGARSVCLLCDGGGSNSADRYLFKEELQKLADRLGVELRACHYPPYCSKYNPIERRLFCHVSRACEGALFGSAQEAKRLMEKTRTEAGLGVVVSVTDKRYETGRKYAAGFRENMRIAFDDTLPRWNYRAVPTH